MSTENAVVSDGQWTVPGDIRVDGDHLVWCADEFSRCRIERRMLDGFRTLRSGDPDRVLRYAARYGVLDRPSGSAGLPARAGQERLEVWTRLAGDVDTVLHAAAKVRIGRGELLLEDWAGMNSVEVDRVVKLRGRTYFDVCFQNAGPLRWGFSGALVDAQQLIALYVEAWLQPVHISFAWHSGREAGVVLQPNSLVGAIGIQLAQAIARTGGLGLMCQSCEAPFAPSHGNQRYCAPCRDLNEPQRLATKNARARKRAAARQTARQSPQHRSGRR